MFKGECLDGPHDFPEIGFANFGKIMGAVKAFTNGTNTRKDGYFLQVLPYLPPLASSEIRIPKSEIDLPLHRHFSYKTNPVLGIQQAEPIEARG